MHDSHPGEFSNCGQSLLTVTSSDVTAFVTATPPLWYIFTCTMIVTPSHGTCKCGVNYDLNSRSFGFAALINPVILVVVAS